MKASDLQPGKLFKLTNRHRNWKKVNAVIELKAIEGRIPPEHDGKLLILFGHCAQIILSPDQEIVIQQ